MNTNQHQDQTLYGHILLFLESNNAVDLSLCTIISRNPGEKSGSYSLHLYIAQTDACSWSLRCNENRERSQESCTERDGREETEHVLRSHQNGVHCPR